MQSIPPSLEMINTIYFVRKKQYRTWMLLCVGKNRAYLTKITALAAILLYNVYNNKNNALYSREYNDIWKEHYYDIIFGKKKKVSEVYYNLQLSGNLN